jgi:DNA-binding transcriptional ArsR family regulator
MPYIKQRFSGPLGTPLPRSVQRLRRTAFALGIISNPDRLRIIFRLAEDARDASQLSKDLGLNLSALRVHVKPLRQGGLIKSKLRGKNKFF